MTIYFDMDGTIADLYGVDNWLDMLRAGDVTPYATAKPLVRLNQLARVLNALQANGVKIGIISWLSKTSTAKYDKAVRQAKREWLRRHMPSVHWDEIHIVKYGTPKYKVCRYRAGILFDDEEKNRRHWQGEAHTEKEIFDVLRRELIRVR